MPNVQRPGSYPPDPIADGAPYIQISPPAWKGRDASCLHNTVPPFCQPCRGHSASCTGQEWKLGEREADQWYISAGGGECASPPLQFRGDVPEMIKPPGAEFCMETSLSMIGGGSGGLEASWGHSPLQPFWDPLGLRADSTPCSTRWKTPACMMRQCRDIVAEICHDSR